MTGRAVPEWVGASPDAAIPARVKLRVWERCGGRCAITGRKIMPGDAYDFDHIIALSVGGVHRESNLQVVLKDPHRAKTAEDVKLKAKLQRIALKHHGLFPKSKRPLKGRGFPKSRNFHPEQSQ